MLASYVDQNWEFRETLLSFDVLKAKHTGATFSGHLTRTLLSFNLGEKWAGTVTSDSTGTNHRMMDMLEQAPEIDKLQPKGRGKAAIDRISSAQMKSSPSAFPYASMRHTYRWTGDENKILCMNHHINLAVRAGFASLGVTIKASSQRKVLNLQPIPAIVVQDEKGNSVEVDFERWLPADTQPPAAPPRSAASRTPAPTRKGKERAIEATLEDDDTVDAGVSSSAGAVVDGTDSQAPAEEKDADDEEEEEEGEYLDDGDSVESSSDEEDMGPEVDEILSDDGGGPEQAGGLYDINS
ncbi:unnamed protein product [Tilletia laevis]|nr:unnamed protein product [Tilletia laevis]